jgi:hypothetical protein
MWNLLALKYMQNMITAQKKNIYITLKSITLFLSCDVPVGVAESQLYILNQFLTTPVIIYSLLHVSAL